MLARLARVLIAAALLAGWQAALLHPLQHSSDGGLVHLGGNSSDKSGLCDVLAALAVCAPQPDVAFDVPHAARTRPLVSTARWRRAEAPPFLAQGPPDTL